MELRSLAYFTCSKKSKYICPLFHGVRSEKQAFFSSLWLNCFQVALGPHELHLVEGLVLCRVGSPPSFRIHTQARSKDLIHFDVLLNKREIKAAWFCGKSSEVWDLVVTVWLASSIQCACETWTSLMKCGDWTRSVFLNWGDFAPHVNGCHDCRCYWRLSR